MTGEAAAAPGAVSTDNQKSEKETFPRKVHRMLLEVESNGRQDVCSFVASGTAFRIHKPRAFEEEIMPGYFTTHRVTSFQRQLNTYGFRRHNDGPYRGAYYHPLFLRDRPEWVAGIRGNRRKRRTRGPRAPGEDEADEDEGSSL